MEKIKSKQFRAIRRALINDQIFAGQKDDCCKYLKDPVMGKTIEDIKFNSCRKPEVLKSYKVITKGKTFELFSICFNHSSSTMYVITMDGKIMYYTFSSIFAPASAAWETLTEVFWYGYNAQMSWIWCSTREAECYDWCFFKNDYREIEFKKIKSVDERVKQLYYHY